MLEPWDDDGLERWSDDTLCCRFRETRHMHLFEELVRRHRPDVFTACLRVLDNRASAEDTTQEAFTRAWRAMDRFDGRNFRAWVRTIAYNQCINELQRALYRYEVPSDGGAFMNAPAGDPDQLLQLAIQRCLEQLVPSQRIVLKLFYLDGFSYQEIAELTGQSEASVKSHIQNGRRMFRKFWNEVPGVE